MIFGCATRCLNILILALPKLLHLCGLSDRRVAIRVFSPPVPGESARIGSPGGENDERLLRRSLPPRI